MVVDQRVHGLLGTRVGKLVRVADQLFFPQFQVRMGAQHHLWRILSVQRQMVPQAVPALKALGLRPFFKLMKLDQVIRKLESGCVVRIAHNIIVLVQPAPMLLWTELFGIDFWYSQHLVLLLLALQVGTRQYCSDRAPR